MNIEQWGKAIASHLAEWTSQPRESVDGWDRWNTIDLVHPFGAQAQIAVKDSHYDNKEIKENERFFFTVNWPRSPYNPNDWFPPRNRGDYTATCAVSRTPESIASDIDRRLLEPYLWCWQKQVQEMADHIAYKEATFAQAQAIAQELEQELDPDQTKRRDAFPIHWPSGFSGYGKIEVRGADNIQIDVSSISGSMALDIVRILKIAHQKPDLWADIWRHIEQDETPIVWQGSML